jgi:hypothetical protein
MHNKGTSDAQKGDGDSSNRLVERRQLWDAYLPLRFREPVDGGRLDELQLR